MDCSIKGFDRSLLKLAGANSSNTASPKHNGNGDGRKTVLLKSNECSSEVLNLLANKACQCYVALGDWSSVQEWQVSVHALKNNPGNPAAASVHLKTDFNYVRALSCFEDGDFQECRAQLELLAGERDDYGLLNSTSTGSKDKLGRGEGGD
uniref:Uncharacterized protein n=1 Tax=Hucho hucho TaxID=62062 RepID=A0A4W5LGW5_9TELE